MLHEITQKYTLETLMHKQRPLLCSIYNPQAEYLIKAAFIDLGNCTYIVIHEMYDALIGRLLLLFPRVTASLPLFPLFSSRLHVEENRAMVLIIIVQKSLVR